MFFVLHGFVVRDYHVKSAWGGCTECFCWLASKKIGGESTKKSAESEELKQNTRWFKSNDPILSPIYLEVTIRHRLWVGSRKLTIPKRAPAELPGNQHFTRKEMLRNDSHRSLYNHIQITMVGKKCWETFCSIRCRRPTGIVALCLLWIFSAFFFAEILGNRKWNDKSFLEWHP